MIRRRHGEEPIDLLDRAANGNGRRGTSIGDALAQRADVLLDHRRVRAEAGDELVEPLGGIGRLVLRHLGRPHLRPRHVVEAELVLLLSERLELVLADQDQQVARDDLLRFEPVGRDCLRLGQGRAVSGLLGGAAIRAEVGPLIVEPLVAEESGPHGVTLENAVPEPVGEIVDGGIGIDDHGHFCGTPC
jgi:hypothetical protein